MTDPISVTPVYSSPGVIGSYDYEYDPSSPAGQDISHQLDVGEETFPRDHIITNMGMTSGIMWLVYFTARKTEITTQVRTYNNSAASTQTLARIGLYSIGADKSGTLIAATENDPTLWATTTSTWTRSWAVPAQKVAGQRYAVAALSIATGMAQLRGIGNLAGNELAQTPRRAGYWGGRADLPETFPDATLTSLGNILYAAVLP